MLALFDFLKLPWRFLRDADRVLSSFGKCFDADIEKILEEEDGEAGLVEIFRNLVSSYKANDMKPVFFLRMYLLEKRIKILKRENKISTLAGALIVRKIWQETGRLAKK